MARQVKVQFLYGILWFFAPDSFEFPFQIFKPAFADRQVTEFSNYWLFML
jgi:hypothetical protein